MTWRDVAESAAGWLHRPEGPALRRYATEVAHLGPLCEIGGYAGKSACWLGSVAQERDTILFSVDWHRGSPEMEPGQDCHDPDMIGLDGVFDTLPHFRRNIRAAGLERWVVPIAGNSQVVGSFWSTPLAFLFIDGSHSAKGVQADYDLWAPHVMLGGILAFHDTPIPGIGRVADNAERDGFTLVEQVESLRVLRCEYRTLAQGPCR